MQRLAKAGCDHHVAATITVGGFEQMRPAEFLVTTRAEPGDNEVALFIRQKEHLAVLDKEGVGPAHWLAVGGGGKGFPEALARIGLETAQLAVAAHTVDVSVLQERGGDDRVQAIGFLLAAAFAPPEHFGRGFGRVEPHHQRSIVEGGHEP